MTIDVHSPDPDVRQKAAQAVATSEKRDLPLMFELLGDRDWRVRKTIVDGLVADSGADVVHRLIDALTDAENAGKRNSATEALIRIGALHYRRLCRLGLSPL